jgi:hypothetical protein
MCGYFPRGVAFPSTKLAFISLPDTEFIPLLQPDADIV